MFTRHSKVAILSPTLAFALKFIIGFAVLMGAFEASRGTAGERFLVEDCILKPTIALVHALAPGEAVQAMAGPPSRLIRRT